MISKKFLSFLILIILFFVIHNANWLKHKRNGYIVESSYAGHFRYTIDYHEALTSKNIVKFVSLIKTAPYPPLFFILSSLILLIFGKNLILLTLIINISALTITLLFTYWIGKKLADEHTAIMAVFLLVSYPAIFGLSRLYSIEFTLIAITSVAIYCILNFLSEHNLKWGLISAASIGIGCMIKPQFMAFTIGPVILAILHLLKRKLLSYKIILISVFLFLVLILTHFNTGTISSYFSALFSESRGAWYSFINLRVYTFGISEEQLSPIFALLFLAGSMFFVRRFKDRLTKWILLLWIIIPWLILVFMPARKETQFIVPYLPAIALISSIGLNSINFNKFKFVFQLVFMIAVIQFYDFSYNIGHELWKKKISFSSKHSLNYINLNSSIITSNSDTVQLYNFIISSSFMNYKDQRGYKIAFIDDGNNIICRNVLENINWFMEFPFEYITIWPFDLDELFNAEVDAFLVVGNKDPSGKEYLNTMKESMRNHIRQHPGSRKRDSAIYEETDWNRIGLQLQRKLETFSKKQLVYVHNGTPIHLLTKE